MVIFCYVVSLLVVILSVGKFVCGQFVGGQFVGDQFVGGQFVGGQFVGGQYVGGQLSARPKIYLMKHILILAQLGFCPIRLEKPRIRILTAIC